jgi:hypothetical protein
VQVKIKQHCVLFEGVLDESCPSETIELAMAPALAKLGADQKVQVDFSGVTRSNSVGLLNWFKVTQRFPAPIDYINAPIWLVEQFNFVTTLNSKNTVTSFKAPFYCQAEDNYETITLEIGKDLQISESYTDVKFQINSKKGNLLEPDFDPEEYLYFLTRIALFQKKNRVAS